MDGVELVDAANRCEPMAVSPTQIFLAFLYIGATSFGGGAVAYLRDHLVTRLQWLDEDEFLAGLEVGETIPGLITTNVAVIVGGRLGGVAGAIAAALGVIMPGAVTVFLLGLLYAQLKHNPDVIAALAGVSAAAVGLILAVALQIGKGALRYLVDLMILVGTFVLVALWHVSLVPVLVVLAPLSIWIYRPTDRASTANYHSRRAAFHAQQAAQHRDQA